MKKKYVNPEKNREHSRGKRVLRLHYRQCPKCFRCFSDVDAHYKAVHAKADRRELEKLEKAKRDRKYFEKHVKDM